MRYLDHSTVVDLYARLVSTYGIRGNIYRRMAISLEKRGLINRDTGRPYTAQALSYVVMHTPEGKAMRRKMADSHKRFVHNDKRFPRFSAEMADAFAATLLDVTQISRVELIGSDLFGFAPIDLAMCARNVFVPLLYDVALDHEPDLAELQHITFQGVKLSVAATDAADGVIITYKGNEDMGIESE